MYTCCLECICLLWINVLLLALLLFDQYCEVTHCPYVIPIVKLPKDTAT